MENFGCEICFEDYDDCKVVPKVLDCGHTICGSCIQNMAGNKPRCPRCQGAIVKGKRYATNYSLLMLTQQKKNVHMKEKTIEDEFAQVIEKLKDCQHLLSQKEVDLEQKVSQVMEECVNKLKDSKRDKETNIYSMVSTIARDLAEKEKTSKRNLEIVTQCLTLMEVQDECKETSGCETRASSMEKVTEMKPDLSLQAFDKSVSYLKKIRERLRHGEVYIAHPFKGKILYGKLCFENLSLPAAWKVSALEAREVPDGASIIELQDFKEVMADYSVCTFLEIRNDESGDEGIIIIDMKPSPRAPQFMKLCTGECGVSYKNCYLAEPIDEEDNYFEYICIVKEPLEGKPKGLNDYIVSESFEFAEEEIIVGILDSGGLSIGQTIQEGSLANMVGVVRENTHVDMMHDDGVGDSWKIEDCGIYFYSKK